MKSSLTAQQQKTLGFIIGTVVLLAVSGWLMWSLSSMRTQAAGLQNEVERKELDAQAVQLPTEEERAGWAGTEAQMNASLLSDEQVGIFLGEISTLANENGLQRFQTTPADKQINTEQPTFAGEAELAGLGIRRYLHLQMQFQSDYADAARFIGAVSNLRRPIEFEMIDMRRNPSALVDANIMVRVYRREPAQ